MPRKSRARGKDQLTHHTMSRLDVVPGLLGCILAPCSASSFGLQPVRAWRQRVVSCQLVGKVCSICGDASGEEKECKTTKLSIASGKAEQACYCAMAVRTVPMVRSW